MALKIREMLKTDDVGEKFDAPFRGVVAELDGRVIGSTGVMYDEFVIAFSTITDEMRSRKKDIVRMKNRLVEIMNDEGVPVLTIADSNEPTARGFLESIGFNLVDDESGVYIYGTG